MGNTFKENSGMRGLVNIEMGPMSKGAALFVGNKFERNSGYLESSAIYYTKISEGEPDQTDIPCGGLHLEANEFYSNGGCRMAGGVVAVECIST